MLSFRNVQIRSIKLLSLILQIIREATPYKDKFLLKNKIGHFWREIGLSFLYILWLKWKSFLVGFLVVVVPRKWDFNFCDFYWGYKIFDTIWKEGRNFNKLP